MRISNNTDENLSTEPVFQQEKPKKFKELNGKQKAVYIWDYYKWWFVFGLVFILIASVTIPSVIENRKEVVLYATFINTQIVDQESTTIMDDFVKAKDIDMDGRRIVLDASLTINRNRADQLSMQCNQKLLALFSSNTLDVILSDDENFQFYAQQGAFQSLEDVLPAELFEKYKPYMLTCNAKDSDETIYYGINVRTSKVLYEEGAYTNATGKYIVEPIFSICTKAKQPENAVKFLEFLMEEEVEIPDDENTVSGDAVTPEVSSNAVDTE